MEDIRGMYIVELDRLIAQHCNELKLKCGNFFSTYIKSYYSKGLVHTNLKLDSPKTVTFKMMGVGVYA